MVNGSGYYKVLESVSVASALPTALTIYTCQIQVHQRWQSELQLPTARKKSGVRPQHTVLPRRLPVKLSTPIHTTLVSLEPTTFRLLVRRATSSATDSLCAEVFSLRVATLAFNPWCLGFNWISRKHQISLCSLEANSSRASTGVYSCGQLRIISSSYAKLNVSLLWAWCGPVLPGAVQCG